MSRKYDSKTTIFSPEGRLYQVEYAMEAISKASTCLGIICQDGIILASEKRNFHELLDCDIEKIFKINEQAACCVAGVTSDANVIIQEMREQALHYKNYYQEQIPLEQLVLLTSDYKQHYTQIGGFRPFGVSILYVGWDSLFGYQVFQSDPSGNYSGWKATCMGRNQNKAISKLKQDFKPEITVEEGKTLMLQIMQECMETDIITAKNMECAIFKKNDVGFNLRYLSEKEIIDLPGNKPEVAPTAV